MSGLKLFGMGLGAHVALIAKLFLSKDVLRFLVNTTNFYFLLICTIGSQIPDFFPLLPKLTIRFISRFFAHPYFSSDFLRKTRVEF